MGHRSRTGTSSAARAQYRLERGVHSENGIMLDTTEQGPRTCLGCGKTFLSLSRGNRQCSRCKGLREPGGIKTVKRVRACGVGVKDI